MAERNYDFTEIKTRIIIRNDISDNWEGSTIVLEKGEPAIEYDAVNKTAKLKFGDGESTFSQLPFSTLTPSEVSSLISDVESGESSKVTTVITSGDGNVVTSGSISDDGTTLTLTKSESFVPVTGGRFTGDVTVSGDFTADNIKTTRNINITSTHKQGNDGDHNVYNKATINFINNETTIDETPIQIEAEYNLVTDASQNVMSNLNLTADNINLNGSICVGNDFIEVYEPIELLNNHFDYPMNIVTKGYVDKAISSAVRGIASAAGAMTFKGTVGTSGTVADIASISSPSTGDTYKIITATSLTSEQSFDGVAHDLTVGDLVVYASNKWVFVPSGNEDVTTVKVADYGDTINVSTTAQTGEVVLGTAAGVNTATSVTNDTTTVPTTNAVKVYVDDLENTLGTAAITDASDYATSAQGTLAENAMPKSGGTFTGDVTVSGDLTADNIKTSGEITITPTTEVDITTDNQEHDNSKITFANNTGKPPISIEAKYKAIYFNSAGHVADSSYLNINAGETHINGSVIIDSDLSVPSIDGIKIDQDEIYINGDYGPKTSVSVHTGTSVNDTSPEINFCTRIPNPNQRITSLELYSNQTEIHNGTNGRILLQNADNSEITLNTGNNSNINLETGTNGNINLNGKVTLQGHPTENLHAATKKYVDDRVSSISTDSLIDGENILILNGGSATE